MQLKPNNNNMSHSQSNSSPENPSIRDLYVLIQSTAGDTKSGFDQINERIDRQRSEITSKITSIEKDLTSIKQQSRDNTEQLEMMQNNVEQLKQLQLKNSVRVSGIPDDIVIENPSNIIMQIAKLLNVTIMEHEFIAYATRHGNSIIVQFTYNTHKMMFINKIRERKSMMAEELFAGVKSNSMIYINDQLTPFFANLMSAARKAKMSKRIFGVTSRNGRVGIKLNQDSRFEFITSERELIELLDKPFVPIDNEAITTKKMAKATKKGTTAAHIVSKRKLSDTDNNNNSNKQRKNTK